MPRVVPGRKRSNNKLHPKRKRPNKTPLRRTNRQSIKLAPKKAASDKSNQISCFLKRRFGESVSFPHTMLPPITVSDATDDSQEALWPLSKEYVVIRPAAMIGSKAKKRSQTMDSRGRATEVLIVDIITGILSRGICIFCKWICACSHLPFLSWS